jgi:hypothetical protein
MSEDNVTEFLLGREIVPVGWTGQQKAIEDFRAEERHNENCALSTLIRFTL